MKFDIPLMDDGSVQRILNAVAPSMQRNYIIPELKANIIAEDRKKCLATFRRPYFTRKAKVLMGEPNADYKSMAQKIILKEKEAKARAERRKKEAKEEAMKK